MPLWTCDFSACGRPVVRSQGECFLCGQHLCSVHIRSQYHRCPEFEDEHAYDLAWREAEQKELTALINRIDTVALAERATALRGGMSCSIPALDYDRRTATLVMGGMNYHVPINFDDGEVWFARIRRQNGRSPPPALRDYIIQSEVATMRFLEQHTGIPVPKVFDYALESDVSSSIGVGYIFTQKMPGRALNWVQTSATQRTKVMNQLADIFVELYRHPLKLMGSFDIPGEPHIGSFALTEHADFEGTTMHTIGPCKSSLEFYTEAIKLTLSWILKDEMYAKHAVDAYLTHRWLLDLAPTVFLPAPDQDEVFYLKHADDKGDHILVDEEYNITAILDWEWAYTAPGPIAFKSPVGLLPVIDFYNGINKIADDEAEFAQLLDSKGAHEQAECVRKGRLYHRFDFCCNNDFCADWSGFLDLFRGLRDLVKVDEGLDWDAWRQVALDRYQHDPGLKELLARSAP